MSPKKAPVAHGLLMADPAWPYSDKLPGPGRGAEKHYPVMSIADIARFPLPLMAEQSWLFLWRTHTHQDEARFVMRAWGFTYRSEIVWVKTTKDGKRIRMGMGRSVRQCHEVCIVASRGRVKPLDLSIPSVILAPRLEHSAKPNEIYKIAQRISAGPFAELFARKPRPGWTTYGNELEEAHP